VENWSYKVKASISEHEHSLFHGVEKARMNGNVRWNTRKKIRGKWREFEVEVVQDREPDRHVSIG
jgi:hypothetical protein